MQLRGTKVKHAVFGTGTIVEHIDNYLTIEFPAKTTKFVYPDAFEKFIKAEDPTVQAEINKELTSLKAAAEQQRQAEDAARKAAENAQRNAATTPNKKAKSIDDMFSEDYHAAHLARQPILTYEEVENQFGIRIAGFGRGINPTNTTVVLISSIGKSSGKFVYHDKWTTDGDYIYSGEGRTGDQSMTKGNLAIKNAEQDGKKIHLFVKFSPQEYYYQGVFNLKGYTYEDEKDEDGNTRKEYKFRLEKATQS